MCVGVRVFCLSPRRVRVASTPSPQPQSLRLTMRDIAFSPRTVTEVEIFSFRRMEKERTV